MRAVLVTGAARGLGAALTERLAADGYAVVVSDVDADGAARVAAGLEGHAVSVGLDVRRSDDWQRGAEALAGAGTPWGLVNCAARTVVRELLAIEPDEWDDVLAVNLRGPFVGIRTIAPLLQAAGGGRIVNVSSDSAFRGVGVTGAHYATSKAGLLALTKRAASALARDGVTVNAVAPGTIAGETVRELAGDRLDELAAASPLGRIAEPREVTALVAWLLSDEASYATGAAFVVDGGASL